MTTLEGSRTLVIGAARTGQSTARFLAARGARVRVLDRSRTALDAARLPAGVEVEIGEEGPARLAGVDLVVPSPGVARDHPLLRQALSRGVPVWSEIELAARFLPCPLLAITGTNGKSTTTVLTGAMLAADGGRVFVGGNLGTPLIDALTDGTAYEAAVVEVSSFQLEWIDSFHPHVAVWLNLTPDHQDRYATFADYGEAKATMLKNQQPDDVAVLNRDDPWVWAQRHRTRAAVLSFGRDPVELGSFVDGHDVVVWGTRGSERYALAESPLRGEHNRENIQAALTAATAWGVSSAAMHAALAATQALPHRLELVRTLRGVAWYDDSKGTNVGAVEKSILSFSGGVILLLGGYDKGGDFTALSPLLRERAGRVICFGAAGPHIAAQIGDVPSETVPDLAAAVAAAATHAVTGQTVLLSPGCASFDEFADYAERGRRFRTLVEAL